MADESELSKHSRTMPTRLRSAGLTIASLVLIVLALWSALILLRRLPQFSKWGVPLGIAFAILFVLAIIWKVPQLQVGTVSGLEPKERFDRVNEARKTLAQIIGGIAVLAGFYSTMQSITVAQKSLAVTQENQIIAQKSFALAQQGQITDRFTKAIEQLGAVDSGGKKKLEVRLGGIYALERIANESESDHWPILEVLTAYIRENVPAQNADSTSRRGATRRFFSVQMSPDVKPAADIQAILTVLARRSFLKSEQLSQRLDLRKTDISGANLLRADLRGALLVGAHLSGTLLVGADLRGALLVEADLRGAYLDGAHLRGADLRGADLTGAHLFGADLSGTDLSGAHLSGALLVGADLRGALLPAADLRAADLSDADLTTAKNLEQKHIESAKGNGNTKLPSNLHTPEMWKTKH